MTFSEIMLLIFSAVLLILLIVCIVYILMQRKAVSDLTESINSFREDGVITDYSVKDNRFAGLQNGVADLENLVILEKSNAAAQTKKNTRFVSDISHQLKTPIAGLRLYCEMENSENPNEHTQKELILIEKMENLIQNLLKLEKIRSDSYVMNFCFYDVGEIIRNLLTQFYHLFPDKRYRVTGSDKLRCDRVWLSEALGNVIKNASEHTADDGTVDINIVSSDNSTIIEICDNGGGIAEEEIPNLFTRFYRSENASPGSTGIGLSITKAVVEKHHGIISAENKNGGLCVTMCLPHIDGYITI